MSWHLNLSTVAMPCAVIGTAAFSVVCAHASTYLREQTHAVREWARKNGHEIGDKGRIPARILEAYNAGN